MSALLELDRARIDDEGGVPAIDGLSLATTGERVLVFGAPRALFEAVSGTRAAAHGAVLIRGEAATVAVSQARVAGAPLDPPLPPRWSARAYVTWSARLAGHGAREASAMADEALARMKLQSVAASPLSRAALAMRRGVVLAAALATGARTIVAEDPLTGLPETHALALGRVLAEALPDRAFIVFASRLALSSPLSLSADEAIVLSGSRVAAQGAPAEVATRDRTYALKVEGDVTALARKLEELGARVTGASERLVVDLGELSTRELLAAALEHGALVVELRSASGAFV